MRRPTGERTALWQKRFRRQLPGTFAQLTLEVRRFGIAFLNRVPEGQIIPLLLANWKSCWAWSYSTSPQTLPSQ
jgi:hypothetical protein